MSQREFWDRLKHELSLLGLTAHLHKDAGPDLDVVDELIGTLRDERQRAHELAAQLTMVEADAAARDTDAKQCVDEIERAVAATREHAERIDADNAALRRQTLQLRERAERAER